MTILSKKSKRKELNTSCQAGDFDWSIYEDGYNGRNLVENKNVQTGSKKIKVYCREHYAEELYKKYSSTFNGYLAPKDLLRDSILSVIDVQPVGKYTLCVLTSGGGNLVIDMTKERDFIKLYGDDFTPELFVAAMKDKDSKESFLASSPTLKVTSQDRISFMDGHVASLEKEFANQLKNPTYCYTAHVLSTNRGGYIVDISGLKCFLPGSMAAAGVVTDFDELIGKDIPVMVVNYVRGMGYVVSYKKYLTTILPAKITEELSIDMEVTCVVTGVGKPGVFVSFNDKEGQPIYTGLIHKDEMCDFMEQLFETHEIRKGDTMRAFIHDIYKHEDSLRIVLGDTPTTNDVYQKKKKRLEQESKTVKGESNE